MSDTNESTLRQAPKSLDVDLKEFSSTALERLINEIRNDDNDKPVSATTYNRTYHRHNR